MNKLCKLDSVLFGFAVINHEEIFFSVYILD